VDGRDAALDARGVALGPVDEHLHGGRGRGMQPAWGGLLSAWGGTVGVWERRARARRRAMTWGDECSGGAPVEVPQGRRPRGGPPGDVPFAQR
jgi:hypothetical protein